jgi:hypothetical protein
MDYKATSQAILAVLKVLLRYLRAPDARRWI